MRTDLEAATAKKVWHVKCGRVIMISPPPHSKPMRPDLEAATAKLEAEQIGIERKVMAGAYHSKRRDQAISNLIKVCVEEGG